MNKEMKLLQSTLEQINGSAMIIVPERCKYDKLKTKMRSLIRIANEVLEEIGKDAPDNILKETESSNNI